MELCSPYVPGMNDSGKFDFIVRRGEDDIRRFRLHIIRMDEIDEARGTHALGQRVCSLRVQLIPTHVRHTQIRWEFDYPTFQQVQPTVQTKFFTLREQQVHPQADSQCWSSGLHFFDESLEKSVLPKVRHG